MSPQEFWLQFDARKPEEKVGHMPKSKFDRMWRELKNAEPRRP
jgi:hypothetical protein